MPKISDNGKKQKHSKLFITSSRRSSKQKLNYKVITLSRDDSASRCTNNTSMMTTNTQPGSAYGNHLNRIQDDFSMPYAPNHSSSLSHKPLFKNKQTPGSTREKSTGLNSSLSASSYHLSRNLNHSARSTMDNSSSRNTAATNNHHYNSTAATDRNFKKTPKKLKTSTPCQSAYFTKCQA